jgi:hypothetical protein
MIREALAFAAGATVGLCVAGREHLKRIRAETQARTAKESRDFWADKALDREPTRWRE